MKAPSEYCVEELRAQYPRGTRLMLMETMNDPQPILAGMCGTVYHVDDAGQIHMAWDNGRGLALIPGVDSFMVVPGGNPSEEEGVNHGAAADCCGS